MTLPQDNKHLGPQSSCVDVIVTSPLIFVVVGRAWFPHSNFFLSTSYCCHISKQLEGLPDASITKKVMTSLSSYDQ